MNEGLLIFDLHRQGCRVQSAVAQSGKELLETLCLHAFDVVIATWAGGQSETLSCLFISPYK